MLGTNYTHTHTHTNIIDDTSFFKVWHTWEKEICCLFYYFVHYSFPHENKVSLWTEIITSYCYYILLKIWYS